MSTTTMTETASYGDFLAMAAHVKELRKRTAGFILQDIKKSGVTTSELTTVGSMLGAYGFGDTVDYRQRTYVIDVLTNLFGRGNPDLVMRATILLYL